MVSLGFVDRQGATESNLLSFLLLLFFTRGTCRYNSSGDAEISGALFLEWLVFTNGLWW